MATKKAKKHIGTLACTMWGHKFTDKEMVYDPHYFDLIERGKAHIYTTSDYHYETKQTNNCTRCGINKKDI